MNERMDAYTDLALEERERFEGNVEISGVKLEKIKNKSGDLTTTKMEICNEHASKIMGKPTGTYITIESENIKDDEHLIAGMEEKGEELSDEFLAEKRREIIDEIESEISKLTNKVGIGKDDKTLIVGLGNINATPDSLGPRTVSMINITNKIICIAPGVLSQTGMETYRIIKGIVNEEKPKLVIAIDSLAARNTGRVATTIQITDTGIIPGSGIDNHRMGLNRETLKIPVIAIGVPMVVDSVTIVQDTLREMIKVFNSNEYLKDMTESLNYMTDEEKHEILDEVMTESMGKMYVTPKEVDFMVDRVSSFIADAINRGIK